MDGNDPQNDEQGGKTLGEAISHVQCRAIQTPIAAMLIRAFGEEIGHEKAVAVVEAAIRADAAKAGRQMAQRCGGNSMADLARVVREVWCRDDGMRIRVLAESATEFRFDVTHCGYAAAYAELGMQDLGVCLSCCRDEPFTRAFNPRITLTRRETIMEGGARCDFHFKVD